MDDAQKTRALDAVSSFREALNSGSCGLIYSRAGAYFQKDTSREWESDCEDLRKEFGTWRGFDFHFAQRCAEPEVVVCIVGHADFEQKSAEVELAWLLDKGDTRLFWIALKRDEQRWVRIPLRPDLNRFHDGPMRKLSKVDSAS